MIVEESRAKWNEFLSGSENAYSWIYKTYIQLLYQYGLRFTLNKESPRELPDISEEEFPYFSLEPTIEDVVIKQEQVNLQSERIKELLSLLSSRQQEIIYYRYIQELSFDEICELMDLNYQSAQNLIQRSFKKLRDNLGTTSLLFFLITLFAKI